MIRLLLRVPVVALVLLGGAARALTSEQAAAMAAGENDARIAALNVAAASGDPRVAVLV